MGTKYKVSQNGTVFGNYPAKSCEDAVLKAYEKNKQYHEFDFVDCFTVKHDSREYSVFMEEPHER